MLGVMSNFAGFGVIRVLTLFNKMLGVVLFSCGLSLRSRGLYGPNLCLLQRVVVSKHGTRSSMCDGSNLLGPSYQT